MAPAVLWAEAKRSSKPPMQDLAAYTGLFAAAFLSATVFPFQSEAALAALVLAGQQRWEWLLAAASLGNTLGSIVNWFLGRFLTRFEDRPWFPASRKTMERAEGWYRRYGRWSLLLSWVPIVGDPLTVIAGVLREPLPVFILLVAIAKTGRYLAVIGLTQGWL